jgi:predicted DCC family thiol-disulfide oxidoreductase YuxK
MSLLSFLKKTFSFDDRSMGLYRVLIGMIVVADVIYRLEDLTNFYTDVGLVPRSIFVSEMSMPWSFSFHLANGSFAFAALMFSIHALFGLMLVFGYKSRWAMVGAYIMTFSVHNRNWLVNNGGDDVLRSILFISIFLPLNRCFSLDSAMQKIKKETTDFFSFWTLTFFLQVFVIYFVSYILKNHPIWRNDFTAVFYSSRLDIFATPLAIWLRDYPFLMKASTAFTIYLEWLGPLLLIGAFLFRKYWWVVRTSLVGVFIAFHFGIFLTMNIGLFTFIAMAMWTLFIPGPLWDKLASIFRKKNYGKVAIYFDGECGFCQKGVRIIREFFLLPEVTVNVAQETPAIYSDMLKNNSWVVVNENQERFFHFSAWVELLRYSPWASILSKFFTLRPVFYMGQKFYLWVSRNRPVMGKASQFLTYQEPKKEIRTFRWLREGAGAFMFVTLFMWNLTTIKKYHINAPFFQNVTRWLHLYQEWNMFAPFPKMDNIWVEVPGTLSDETQIDVVTGSRDIYAIKDQEFYQQIPNEHWRKFYLNLSERNDYARYYGGYLCRLWNDRKIQWVKGTTLRKMEIIVYSQLNLQDGDKGGISRKLSWKHWCFDEDYKQDNPKP